MFNRTYIQEGNTSHTHTTTEKRAPTDQSVRLLNEMQDAALKNVEKHFYLDNDVQGRVIVSHHYATMEKIVSVFLSINGRDVKFQLDPIRPRIHTTIRDVGNEILSRISERIAEELMTNMKSDLSGITEGIR